MLKRLSFIVAMTIGALTGLSSAIRSPRLADNLTALVREQALLLGIDLSIDRLEPRLWPPGLAAHNVVARRINESASASGTLDYGVVAVRPWPSATGAFVIERLELDGLALDLRVDPALLFTKDSDRAPRIDIRNLSIRNSSLMAHHEAHNVTVPQLDLSIEPTTGGRAVRLDLVGATVRHAERAYKFDSHAQLRVSGTLDRPLAVELETAELSMSGFRILAKGALSLVEGASGDEGAVLVVESHLQLRRLAALIPEWPAVAGQAYTRVTLRQRPDVPLTTRVELSVKEATLHDRPLGDVQAELLYGGGAWTIESFALQDAAAGRITGSAQILVDTTGARMQLTSRLHGVSLPLLLERAGIDGAWVRGELHGDLQASGQLFPLRLDVNSRLRLEGFESLNGSHAESGATAMLSLEPTTITGTTRVESSKTTLLNLELARGNSQAVLQGVLHHQSDRGLDITAWSKDISFADLGPLGGIPFRGRGALESHIKGPYNDIHINSNIYMEGFQLYDFYLGDADAALEFHRGILSAAEMEVNAGAGVITGRGFIDFNDLSCRAHAQIEQVAAAALLRMSGLAEESTRALSGSVSGTIDLSGPLLLPSGSANLSSPDLALHSAHFGESTLNTDFAQGRVRAQIALAEAREGGSSIRAVATLVPQPPNAPAGPYGYRTTIDLRSKALSLKSLQPLMGDALLTGALSGKAHLDIDEHGIHGDYEATVFATTAWGIRLETVASRGAINQGELQLQGSGLSGDCTIEGSLVLTQELPYSATVSCSAIDANRVMTLHADTPATIAGTLFSQGTLTDSASHSADANLSRVSVTLGPHQLENVDPVRIQYNAGELQLMHLQMRDSALALTASGALGLGGPLDLQLALVGDAALLGALPSVERATGAFHSQLTLQGTWEEPTMFGTTVLQGVDVVPRGLRLAIEDINVDLRFAGRTVTWRLGRAKVGGGVAGFEGGFVFADTAADSQLDLILHFKDVTVRPQRDLSLRASGNLVLNGGLEDLTLSGDVDLHEAEYRTRVSLDLQSLFSRSRPRFVVPDASDNSPINLDVRVRARNNLLLNGGAVEAEMKADLQITGTLQRPGALGTMTALWGTARYLDLEFKLERGTVDFVDRFSVNAQYELLANAEGCGMQLEVGIRGDSAGAFELTPRGSAPGLSVTQDQVLACIVSGTAPGNASDRTAATGLGGSGWRNIDALFEVTGVRERLRELFPGVDEQRITAGPSGKDNRILPRLVLGKRLGEDLVLRYEGAPQESDHVIHLDYSLTDKLSVSLGWDSISQVSIGDLGIDLRLQVEHD